MQKTAFNVSLAVTFIREGDQFVAYSPALDLSTAGDTLDEAKKRFSEAVDIFVEETVRNKTLFDVLSELGWQKQNSGWFPPTVVGQTSEAFTIPLTA